MVVEFGWMDWLSNWNQQILGIFELKLEILFSFFEFYLIQLYSFHLPHSELIRLFGSLNIGILSSFLAVIFHCSLHTKWKMRFNICFSRNCQSSESLNIFFRTSQLTSVKHWNKNENIKTERVEYSSSHCFNALRVMCAVCHSFISPGDRCTQHIPLHCQVM